MERVKERERGRGNGIGESWHAFVSAATACMHACMCVCVRFIASMQLAREGALLSFSVSPIYLSSGACVCIYFYVNACVSLCVCVTVHNKKKQQNAITANC